MALRTALYVAIILAVFALLGSLVLEAFGITLPALQLAGGVVVAHSGFGMITASPRLTDGERDHAVSKDDVSFSPMAVPLIAGPGAMGVVIALASRHPALADRAWIAVGGVLIGGLFAACLALGAPLVRRLGPTGVGAITRIMGFLILAIGAELVLHGVRSGLA